MTDQDILAQLSPLQVMGLTVFGEARGESLEGGIAVAQVIRNRQRDGRWGVRFKDVMLARLQFSCWNATDPNRALLLRLGESLLRMVDPGVEGRGLTEALWMADGVMNGMVRDLVKGSTHYHEVSILPAWAKGRQPVVTIGHHAFYTGIA